MNLKSLKSHFFNILFQILPSQKEYPSSYQTKVQTIPLTEDKNPYANQTLKSDSDSLFDLSDIQPNAIKNTLQFNQQTYIPSSLFSKSELYFYQRLKKMLQPKYDVLFEVSLSAVIQLNPNITLTDKQKFFLQKEFANKRLDFVIIDQAGKIFCVIELDDPSHDNEKAKQFDSIKDNALHCANIPLIRIRDTKYLTNEQLFNTLFTQNHKGLS